MEDILAGLLPTPSSSCALSPSARDHINASQTATTTHNELIDQVIDALVQENIGKWIYEISVVEDIEGSAFIDSDDFDDIFARFNECVRGASIASKLLNTRPEFSASDVCDQTITALKAFLDEELKLSNAFKLRNKNMSADFTRDLRRINQQISVLPMLLGCLQACTAVPSDVQAMLDAIETRVGNDSADLADDDDPAGT